MTYLLQDENGQTLRWSIFNKKFFGKKFGAYTFEHTRQAFE
jgi:hypothetical protein